MTNHSAIMPILLRQKAAANHRKGAVCRPCRKLGGGYRLEMWYSCIMSGLVQSVLTTAKGARGKSQEPKMLSAAEMARAPFDDVLASARRNALTVTHKGKPVAVLLSTSRYRRMLRAISALMEEAEDREWAQKARRAKKQGFASRAESEALLREINAANNGD